MGRNDRLSSSRRKGRREERRRRRSDDRKSEIKGKATGMNRTKGDERNGGARNGGARNERKRPVLRKERKQGEEEKSQGGWKEKVKTTSENRKRRA